MTGSQIAEKVWSAAHTWARRGVAALLLLALLGTGLGLLGVSSPLPRLNLTQDVGVWLAGAGFLLSKI